MGNSSKSNGKKTTTKKANVHDPVMLVPATIYNYFRGPDDEAASYPMGLKRSDFINIIINYAERTEERVPNDDEVETAAIVILRDKFKIPVEDLPIDSTIMRTIIVVPRSFTKNEITTPQCEDITISQLGNIEIKDDQSETGKSESSKASSQVTAQSDRPLSIASSRSSMSSNTANPREQRLRTKPSKKTPQDKINEPLNNLLSETRLKVLNHLRSMLKNTASEDSSDSLNALIFQLTAALLKDVLDGTEATQDIVKTVCSKHLNTSAETEKFFENFSGVLWNVDSRPDYSSLQFMQFLARLGIAFTDKPKYYFGDSFDLPLSKELKNLGKFFREKCAEYYKFEFEKFLSPLCCAAIQILKNKEDLIDPFKDDEFSRYHLIVTLIHHSLISQIGTINILTQHSNSELAGFIKEKLERNTFLLSDSVEESFSTENRMDFLFNIAFLFNELPRYVINTDSKPKVLATISQNPLNLEMYRDIQREARRLEDELNPKKPISPVKEEEPSPVKQVVKPNIQEPLSVNRVLFFEKDSQNNPVDINQDITNTFTPNL